MFIICILCLIVKTQIFNSLINLWLKQLRKIIITITITITNPRNACFDELLVDLIVVNNYILYISIHIYILYIITL
jgi:hypothetical protein